MTIEPFLSRYSAGFDPPVRGYPITGERYYSPDYMALENKNLWPRVWHLGGMVAELEEAGDFRAALSAARWRTRKSACSVSMNCSTTMFSVAFERV